MQPETIRPTRVPPFRGGTIRSLGKRRTARGLPGLLLMTDARRLPDPLVAVAHLPRGSGVILRHYGDPAREALACKLARLCARRGLVLLVAGDGALAARIGARGLHLPEARAREIRRFRRARPTWLITVAAHSWPALRAAAGADAALLSPVFATRSHPGARPLGVLRFAALARRSPVPAYALGGIGAANLRRLKGSCLAGAAAISEFMPRATESGR